MAIMTIDDVKEHVKCIEGFYLQINGNLRTVDAVLNSTRLSSNEMIADRWISKSFPAAQKGAISITLCNGIIAKPKDSLEKIRATYPPKFRADAREIMALSSKVDDVENKLQATKSALKIQIKKVNAAERQEKISMAKNAKEFNDGLKKGEREAGYQTIETALEVPGKFNHIIYERWGIVEYPAYRSTEMLINWLLIAWSNAEGEKERLNGNLKSVEESLAKCNAERDSK